MWNLCKNKLTQIQLCGVWPLISSFHIHQTRRFESACIHLRWTTVYIYGIAPELSKLSHPCYNIVQRDLDHMDTLQNITLVICVTDIRSEEYKVANALEVLAKVHFKGWEINPTKSQGLVTAVKFLGVQWSGVFWNIPSQRKGQVISSYTSHL